MEPEIQAAQEVSGNVCLLNVLQNDLRLSVWRMGHTTYLKHGQLGDNHLIHLGFFKLYSVVIAFLPAVERYAAHRQG